ncbi:MAG: TfoX/Sxy family protein [Pseudomonadota bacterium]
MTNLTDIRNIGPAVAQQLIAAGIPDAETLRALGADAAYAKMLAAGTQPHFIGYYVLHMALHGRPWNDCKGKEKEAFRKTFDALVATHKTPNDTGIEKILNDIGTGIRRG